MFRAVVTLAILASGCRQILGFDDVTGLDASSGVDTPVDTATDGDAAVGGTTIRIDVVTGAVTGGPHVDFPLLVSFTDPVLRSIANGGSVASDAGFDLVFVDDADGTQRLSYEIEQFDPIAGTLVAWVKVPQLTVATSVFLELGDPTITTSQEDAAGVWAGYANVLHLAAVTDATGHATTTDEGTTAAVGQIAGARTFDGATTDIVVSGVADNANVFDGGGTFEAWFLATGGGENGLGRVFDKNGVLACMGQANIQRSFEFGQGFTQRSANWLTQANTISLNTWTHVVVTYDSSSTANNPTIYIDAVEKPSAAAAPPLGTAVPDDGNDLVIGDRSDSTRAFSGALDEIRFSKEIRDADWIATEFANQSDPSSFLSITILP